ncbi:hypothetical protein BVRB_1g008650 [Beta vulgaris subsp. vulgaris]|nr:hypothetical protein BVRB_1g008650 [Beta vulgaris subsp. vulgaris]
MEFAGESAAKQMEIWIREEFVYITRKRDRGIPNLEEEARIRQELQLPQFSGKNLDEWIEDLEDFVHFFRSNEELKFKVAIIAFVGDVQQWFEEEHWRRSLNGRVRSGSVVLLEEDPDDLVGEKKKVEPIGNLKKSRGGAQGSGLGGGPGLTTKNGELGVGTTTCGGLKKKGEDFTKGGRLGDFSDGFAGGGQDGLKRGGAKGNAGGLGDFNGSLFGGQGWRKLWENIPDKFSEIENGRRWDAYGLGGRSLTGNFEKGGANASGSGGGPRSVEDIGSGARRLIQKTPKTGEVNSCSRVFNVLQQKIIHEDESKGKLVNDKQGEISKNDVSLVKKRASSQIVGKIPECITKGNFGITQKDNKEETHDGKRCQLYFTLLWNH